MKKDISYKSANLPSETIEYIKEIENQLTQKMGKDITLVAYSKSDGRK